MNFLRSASDSYIDVLDNPWFDRDVDRLGLRNVPQIPFRRYLIDLNRRLKRLLRETRSKPLETSQRFPKGREKRGTVVKMGPRRFLERHGLYNGFVGRKYFL